MAYDLLTKKNKGRDWSISVSGEGPDSKTDWLAVALAGAGGVLMSNGMKLRRSGLQVTSKTSALAGVGLTVAGFYRIFKGGR